MDEMVLKIKACIEVKKKLDPDFVINARTDAIAVSGVEEAIKRGNAYAEAGADLIFIEAPRTREDIIRLVKEIQAPISINLFDAVSGGKTPLIDIDELKEMGVARVSIPVGPLFAAVKGMINYLDVIKDGIAEGRNDLVVPFAEFKELVGFNKYRELEKKFLPEYIP
jgi:methylisocitrate lyase